MKKIRNSKKPTPDNCFAIRFPNLIHEWHPTKNQDLKPNMVTYGSHKKVWWICDKGHEWLAMINDRTNLSHPHNCPSCSNRIFSKENCLSTIRPDLINEWHPIKNKKSTPNNTVASSTKNIWWICPKGHEYITHIRSRAIYNTNCPYCYGIKVNNDNCLLTKKPGLCREWNYIRNKDITPKDVTANSGKKVWWICDKKHEWLSKINDRVTNKMPHLCNEWNYSKNGNLKPNDVSFGSLKKVWWVCSEGHEWKDTISHRSSGRGCIYCGKVIFKDGSVCSSLPEAIIYLEYINKKITFKHNDKYPPGLGKCRYDFYIPYCNKYIEVTSYSMGGLSSQPGRYFKYLRKIVKKRRFVENVLKAKFEFIQFIPIKKQIQLVRENTK